MSRTARAGALAAAVLCLVAAAPAMAAPASDGPTAGASGRCSLSISEQRNLGPTYVISLSTRGVSCRTAKRVVRAYHSCRFRNGGRDGRCRRRVLRYRCRETRNQRIRTQFDARVTCSRGSRRITHTYQQNT